MRSQASWRCVRRQAVPDLSGQLDIGHVFKAAIGVLVPGLRVVCQSFV